MRIVGIDPGYATTGYAILNIKSSKNYELIDCGVVKTKAETYFPERLEQIYKEILNIFSKYKPNIVSIESLYFQNNQKTAIAVAQARGVIILAAQISKVSIVEYTPLQVKFAVTGCGKSKKMEIMKCTRTILKLDFLPKPDDAADAIAIAICHADRKM
ncbi:MAG: crossover junction endodeoxyribonuclease RuvC [Candidatus Improbicoccus devescovinae]|nr:MAG: crossover junction endodeoxyribonuclease RuvC [Candidatus Improbicoccus devescovinae]